MHSQIQELPLMYWVGQKVHYVFSIKDTFFTFTNTFIDLDILSMSAISCYWLLVGRDWGAAKHLPMHYDSPTAKNYLVKMLIVPRNFANHF